MKDSPVKILYLFNATRSDTLERVRGEKEHDGSFMSMLRLKKFGILANFQEIELVFPKSICLYIRKYLPIYFIHLPIFWKIFNYDIIFSSSAFGTQTLHALCPFIKSKCVMIDFSITGFLNKKQTSSS